MQGSSERIAKIPQTIPTTGTQIAYTIPDTITIA